MKSKYLFCLFIVLLVTGTAMALPLMLGEFGRKITFGNGISNSDKSGLPVFGPADKHDEPEDQSATLPGWDYGDLYGNSPRLAILGRFDYRANGDGNETSYTIEEGRMDDAVRGLALNEEGDMGLTTPNPVFENNMIDGALSEPATIILIGSGLIGIAGFGRKKLLK